MLWPRKRKWLRPIVALYPLAMAFTLIYAGEHYFSDIVLGWMYAVATLFAARALTRWTVLRTCLKTAGSLLQVATYGKERSPVSRPACAQTI